MSVEIEGGVGSLDTAREAKTIVQHNSDIRGYVSGIGISRDHGDYVIKVNVDKLPPRFVLERFPLSVATSGGGVVRVIYVPTGPVVAAELAATDISSGWRR